MRAGGRTVRIRIDRDVVELDGRRLGRTRSERWEVAETAEPFGVLESAIRASPLLRPGRACEIAISIESPRTLYRTLQGTGESRAEDGRFDVVLPDGVRDVLEPILARRRVHGRAWFAPGPAKRAVATIRARAAVGSIGRGLIVDRSSAAVTVLLIDGPTIRWARGASPGDAPDTAAVLLRRAGEVVNGAYGLHFWHLEDVARPADEARRRREQREFEARCHALVGFLPRSTARAR